MTMKRVIEGLIIIGLVLGAYWLGSQQAQAPTSVPAATGQQTTNSPLRIITLPVPEAPDLSVTFGTTSPGTGYPMGRYEAENGPERGSLVALDVFMATTSSGFVVPVAHNAGGSGEFFYLAEVVQQRGGLTHEAYYPLGDRVDIASVIAEGQTVIVTYRTHALGQSMAERPEELTSRTIRLDETPTEEAKPTTFGPDNTATTPASIAGDYTWQGTRYADGERVAPRAPEQFVLSLLPDGDVSASTDCNQISGSYRMTPGDGSISFNPLAMTEMACRNDDDLPSQDQLFAEMLSVVERYQVLSDGTLELEFANGEGVMTLTP